jgi:predicted  nucleic acid-binding Zn-ribbon protein
VTMLKEKDQFVESKSIEIEAVKKQLKGLSAQFDQREVMLKRTHLSERIKLKESELKDLVSEQTAIESEIRQREEKMRAVLAKQEKIEKEIVGAKQSQRHLNEQANKDDSGFDKLKKTESPSNGNTPNA